MLRRRVWLVAAGVVAVAGCSGGDDTVVEPLGSPASTTTTTQAPDPVEEAEAVWREVWAAEGNGVDDLIVPEGRDRVVATVETNIESIRREIASNPNGQLQEDGTVTISDCLFADPPVSMSATHQFIGVVTRVDDGWQITDLRMNGVDPCVPAEMADAAIAAWSTYWDAREEFWRTPDPTSPLIAETMTGGHLEHTQALVEQGLSEGWAFRGRPQLNPEVIKVESQTELMILECHELPPDFGAFVLETNERRDDLFPPIRPGMRRYMSAVMKLEDNTWKVARLDSQVDYPCEFAPTDRGLPSL